jgi:transposase-like protein
MIVCPLCRTPTTHRSRPRFYDLLLLLILLRPYRCMSCYKRFYKFAGADDEESPVEETNKET